MGAIIWIIIIIWVVVAVSKGKSQSKNQGSSQSAQKAQTMQQKAQANAKHVARQNDGGRTQTSTDAQRELKARLAKKYKKSTDPDILKRAKASVAEDFNSDDIKYQAAGSYDTGRERAKGQEAMAGRAGSAGSASRTMERSQGTFAAEAGRTMERGQGTSPAAKAAAVAAKGGPAGFPPDRNRAEGNFANSSDITKAGYTGVPENGPSDMMKDIEDLMIKGPDTNIAFERDFVSEGLDLLNRIQV